MKEINQKMTPGDQLENHQALLRRKETRKKRERKGRQMD